MSLTPVQTSDGQTKSAPVYSGVPFGISIKIKLIKYTVLKNDM